MIKSFAILKKKAGLTQKEFCRYWREEHGPLAAKVIPGLRKYVQCHPVKLPGFEFAMDGIVELWWDDVKSLQNYFIWRQSEEASVLIEDEKKFIDTSQMVRFFAEEHIIVER